MDEQNLVLHLTAYGFGSSMVPVANWEEASQMFRKYVDDNFFGCRDLGVRCGVITKGSYGQKVGQVSYNGNVWNPDADQLFYTA